MNNACDLHKYFPDFITSCLPDIMGTAYSKEDDGGGAAGDVATATSSNYGFSKQDAQHLAALQRLVCQEQHNASDDSFMLVLWRCSHLLSINSKLKSPSLPSSVADIEAHLGQHSLSELTLAQKEYGQLKVLFTQFTAVNKMDVTLSDLFMKEDCFLEKVSNLLGIHGNHQRDALDFVCTAYSDKDSISAKDVVGLCFETASVLNCILQEEIAEAVEARDVSAEESMLQALTNSLLEYAKSSRDNNYFGGYENTGTSGSTTISKIEEGQVTRRELSEWQRKVVPDMLLCSVMRFLHILFFPQVDLQQQQQTPKSKSFPIVRSSQEIISQTSNKVKEGEVMPISSHVFGKNTVSLSSCAPTPVLSPAIFVFASISMSKFGEKWYRIFAGETDGWTFQSLEHAILGYEGPTLLVIQAHSKSHKDDTVTLGAYTGSKWEKNKKDFFGTSDCFLFQLQPTLRVLKPLPKMGTRGGHYMYFHSNTNVSTTNPSRKDDLAVGLGFGGTVRSPRFFIDSHLEECTVSSQDTSFEEGNLGLPPSDDPFSSQTYSSTSTLHIDSLEIYAVGDEDTISRGFKAQYQHRDINEATLRNARTVDKAAFLGDMRNGVIESKAFAHRGQVDGRAHGCMKGEEDGKANGL